MLTWIILNFSPSYVANNLKLIFHVCKTVPFYNTYESNTPSFICCPKHALFVFSAFVRSNPKSFDRDTSKVSFQPQILRSGIVPARSSPKSFDREFVQALNGSYEFCSLRSEREESRESEKKRDKRRDRKGEKEREERGSERRWGIFQHLRPCHHDFRQFLFIDKQGKPPFVETRMSN